MRDNFSSETIDVLSKRVGFRCSNPNCRQPTSGPQTDSNKAINVGVAAHITAAAKKGPRHDECLSAFERKSIENGIWLCQICAKLIDNDPQRYTVDLLKQWKKLSEEAALLAIEQPNTESQVAISDIDIIKFFAQCFDRPAFQDEFRQEGSTEAFDKAIEHTITAINTGCLYSRDGKHLDKSKGKAFLNRSDWRQRMDEVVDLLRAIRSRYVGAQHLGIIHVSNCQNEEQQWHCINDPALADWMDSTRRQVLDVFGKVCQEAGVVPPTFPRHKLRHW